MTDTYDAYILSSNPSSLYLFYHSHNSVLLLRRSILAMKSLIEFPEVNSVLEMRELEESGGVVKEGAICL